jgi:gamma-polyglutamate synthase
MVAACQAKTYNTSYHFDGLFHYRQGNKDFYPIHLNFAELIKMNAIWVLIVTTLILVALGLIEAIIHRRNLARIPIRIHVNGTRGKSSVTRLIAAGLRQGGRTTSAKTTGTLARMILPDGTEYPVFRPAMPNIIEQLRIIRTAASFNSQALVLECMALQPPLQWLSEAKLVRATHGVITNARPDHLDIMGPTQLNVAQALAGTVPFQGVLFTAERRPELAAVFAQAATDRRSEFFTVGEDEITSVTSSEMAGFTYVEHEENVALALKVCQSLGVDRKTALAGMWAARPDPGVMTIKEIDFFGRRIFFVNGFAANDPESTQHIWNMALDRFGHVEKRIAIFNCREDRPDRSRQLGQACAAWRPADYYVLMGTGTYIFARAAADRSLDTLKLVFAEDRRVEEIFEIVINLVGRSALVMGMGNIGGQGLDLVQFFHNRSKIKEI